MAATRPVVSVGGAATLGGQIEYPPGAKATQGVSHGDAAGDVMFGLEPLLLPQLCATNPSFRWYRNRYANILIPPT